MAQQGIKRRVLLQAMAAAPLVLHAGAAAARQALVGPSGDRIEANLRRYIGFGSKASGGVGDNACGAWIAEELAKAGYTVERSTFDVPFFDPAVVELRIEGAVATLIPQAIVTQTPEGGVTGPLVRFDPEQPSVVPAGAIALVDLPREGWSTVTHPIIRNAVTACEQAGARGVIIVTNGPTGEAIALNAPGDVPLFAIPTACLAPRDAESFLKAAKSHAPATLEMRGHAGRRSAFNVVGRWSAPGAEKNVIVTTPRSGWLTCAAERGPGIAIWLDLMRWLPTSGLKLNVVFSSNSGHEYENLGASHQVEGRLPTPDETALFLLFGAGLVTKATEERNGKLVALPKPNLKRFCIVTQSMDGLARSQFSGWEGWTDPSFVNDGGSGEAGTAIRAGYPHVIGFVGVNPYHHVAGDTGDIVDANFIWRIAQASRSLLMAL